MIEIVKSKDNSYIKEVNLLKIKKYRDSLNLFILEGEKFVLDNIEYAKYILINEDYYNKNSIIINHNFKNVTFKIIENNLFSKIIDTVSTIGIFSVCYKKKYDFLSIPIETNCFYVVCDKVQDPGNLGTIIRTCESAKASGVICLTGTCDAYNTKTIRSSAGSILNIPIYENVDEINFVEYFKKMNVPIIGTHLKSQKYYYEINAKNNICVIIGNEGNGISNYITNNCDQLVKIPMLGDTESLNASVSSGIIIYDVVRQRLKGE